MGILAAAKPVIIICTRDRTRALAFYRDVLGLRFLREDALAAVFACGETELRLSTVADFTPHGHTILGFNVTDVGATVAALGEKGAVFKIIPGLMQDEHGICSAPGGAIRVAWLEDPDGNILSISNVLNTMP